MHEAVRWLKGWFDTLTAGTLTIGSGSVTDSSGAISFGDENLTTTGTLFAGGATAAYFTSAETITAPTVAFKPSSATTSALYLGNATADGPLIKLMDTAGTARGTVSIENSTAKTLLTTGYGFKIAGNQEITGSLSKGSGSFRIDHPLKPETHQLVHSFTESPQADLLYSGTTDLVGGEADINLDEYHGMTAGTFVALNRNLRVFTTNETDWEPIKGSVVGNILHISCQDAACSDSVSWLVIGERHDQHMMDTDWTDDQGRVVVEPLKSSRNKMAGG